MAANQRSCPGVGSDALRDPRDMVKAGLPEVESPEDAISRPSERRLKPAPRPASVSRPYRGNFRGAERCPAKEFKEMSRPPKSRYHVRRRRTWDRLRGALRREVLCHIPSSAGRNSEESFLNLMAYSDPKGQPGTIAWCATKRLDVSPAKPGGIRRNHSWVRCLTWSRKT